jgi:hypothetical protein
MKRSPYTCTLLGIVAAGMVFALAGCHSPASSVPGPSRGQQFSPNAAQHQASVIDSNPGLTPAQKAAAKANLQQEYGGGRR